MAGRVVHCGGMAFGSGSLLAEGRKSIQSFLGSAPSVRALWRSRRSRFDDVHAILPSTATVGEPVSLTVQAWDTYERIHRAFDGAFRLESSDPDAAVPARVRLEPSDDGVTRIDDLQFATPGTHYLTLHHPALETGRATNPIAVTASPPEYRLYWGDIHLHSKGSDGVGTVQKGLRFGRDAMALDVVAYTDHDTMGFFIPPSLQRWRMHHHFFDRTKAIIEDYNDPGSFVTLFGYEWTKQPSQGGHINVYFDSTEAAELFDSRSAGSRTYEELWARLRRWRERTGADVVTIPHHPAEAMYPFDFSAIRYDDELAPLVEVYSQWGSSEYRGDDGNPKPIGGIAKGEVGTPGHYVQDALAMGHRIGLMASSDFHGPLPGHSLLHVEPHLPRLSEFLADGIGWGHIWRVWDEESYPGGLVGFFAPSLTRESIFGSLRGRQVYGTSQPHRILVRFGVNETRLRDPGVDVTVDEPTAERHIRVSVAGTGPLERVTVVKNNTDWATYQGTTDQAAGLDAYTMEDTFVDDGPITGMAWDDDRGTDADVYYVRVQQADGGMAWAGPLWVSVG